VEGGALVEGGAREGVLTLAGALDSDDLPFFTIMDAPAGGVRPALKSTYKPDALH
jgi:hypothetical protein